MAGKGYEMRHKWSQSEINFCIRLRKEGRKYDDIADILTNELGFHVSKGSVNSIVLKHYQGSKKSSKNDTVTRKRNVYIPYENKTIGEPIDISLAGKNSCRYIIDDRKVCNAPIHSHDMCEYHFQLCYYVPEKKGRKNA